MSQQYDSVIAPAGDYEEIPVPSGGHTFGATTRSIYVGADGDLVIIRPDGTDLLVPGLKGGTVYPFRANGIKGTAAGTTITGANEIIGLMSTRK